MPTIIDSLIVRLGLDSSPLDKGTKPAVDNLDKIDGTGRKTTSTVKNLTGAMGTFLALIGGTVAIRRFVEDFIETNAALDRFSKNIGLSVETISAWGNAVEGFGGSAKSAQGTLDMLSKAQTEMRLTGESSLIPYFSMLGVSLAGVAGQARPVDDILLDLAERFSHMDRTTANNLGRMMGIDQDTLNLLLQGREEVELTIKRQKEYGAATKAQAAEATKLQRTIVGLKQQFNAFGRELVMLAAPALEKLLGFLQNVGTWVQNNKEFVTDFLAVLAVGLAGVAIAALPLTGTVALIGALSAAIALLWQDYQTWKRGGDSLIDWAKWEPGIKAAAAGIEWLAHKAAASFETIRAGAKVAQDAIHGNFDQKDNDAFRDATAKLLGLKPLADNPEQAATVAKRATGKVIQKIEDTPAKWKAYEFQKFFEKKGWAPEQAAGIAANIMSESNGNPEARGDKGTSYGLAQWHADRQADFKTMFGHHINQSTTEEQLEFINHELKEGRERRAGKALSGSTSAKDAGAIVSRLYERPADTDGEASRRGNLADLLNQMQSMPTKGATPAANGPVDRSVQTTIGSVVVQTQATNANGIARDMGGALDFLFTSQANAGLDG